MMQKNNSDKYVELNPVHFYPVEQHLYTPEIGNYKTYGICASSGCGDPIRIDDVSCDAAFVNELAEQFTLLQVSPLQLYDVVLDALV